MTREEKYELAIYKGYTYNPTTGKIYGVKNKEIIGKNTKGYIIIQLWENKKSYKLFAHQFAWYWVHKETIDCIDHINRIKDDNRIINLRKVTHKENKLNQDYDKIKGYSFYKSRNKYKAEIKVNGKSIYLGYYKTEDEARKVYLEAKQKYNFIEWQKLNINLQ